MKGTSHISIPPRISSESIVPPQSDFVKSQNKRLICIVVLVFFLAGCSAPEDCFPVLEPQEDPSKTTSNLDQCWKHEDLIRYYTTNIGTQLVPYKLVMPLELAIPDETDPTKLKFSPFFTKFNIEKRWHFLALDESDLDEHSDVRKEDIKAGWPVGFVIDERTSGKPAWWGQWLGPTCAACHTGQIEYTDKNGKEWKIRIPGGPAMADVNLFLQDLKNSLTALHEDGVNGGAKFKQYEDSYAKKFGPPDPKDLLGEKDLLGALKKVIDERTGWHKRNDPSPSLPHGNGRLDAFGVIYNEIIEMTGKKPVGLSKTDAPVSYPFLWHFSHHNQTQWNGSGPAMPMLVNVAAALGTFAKYDPEAGWFEDPSTTRLSAMRQLQELIDRLRSPLWPQDILGTRDQDKAAEGKRLFEARCLQCHAVQRREEPVKRIKVKMVPVGELHTDGKMVENADHRALTDQDGTNKMPLAEVVAKAAFDIIFSSSHPAEVLPFLVEAGAMLIHWGLPHDEPDDYKARPLEGIWTTAPYLHNGSVANLYELLLPEKERMTGFCVGSREFDPSHVGFETLVDPDRAKRNYGKSKQDCESRGLFWLDTTLTGNHNTGHEYGVCSDTDAKCKQEILQLVEYMKAL